MIIAGLQKISLIDYPNRPCAIIFTQGCSFRCSFCHNPELIPGVGKSMIDAEEVFRKLIEHKKMVDAVTVTGGEPTLQADLIDFIRRLKDEGFSVKLDTNGTNPATVKKLIEEKLVDYFAMDLKNRWENYDAVTNTGSPTVAERPKETMALIQNSGIDHEFRTTILPGVHTAEDFMVICSYLKPGEKYFIQDTRFDVTYDPTISHEHGFDLDALIVDLRGKYPELIIEKR